MTAPVLAPVARGVIGYAVWTVLLLGGCASTAGAGEPAAPPPGDSSRLLATEEAEARRAESAPAVEPPAVAPAPPTPSAGGVCAEFVRPGVLRRAAVARVVDRGLGQWLSQVEVKALRSGRKFTGWQVLQLYPDDPCYRVVDIQRGDVVTKVNGTSLERPDQANQVFQKLRTGPGLEIDLLRQGVARRVSLTIVD